MTVRVDIAADSTTDVLRRAAFPLTGAAGDYDGLLERIRNARFVLLGEASHGTREFYHARAEITRRLIMECGFTAVAVEADWPDAYRVNRFVRGESEDTDADTASADFKRFPNWMWRNTEVREFVAWLRGHNDGLTGDATKAGFYGIDLYSLYASIEAVLRFLDRTDPDAAKRARDRYGCFEQFAPNSEAYGYAAALGMIEPCEENVVAELMEVQRRAAEEARRDGRADADTLFYVEQNARLVKNAEEYYRSMFRGRTSSWNLRDCHMAETLDALAEHLDRTTGRQSRIVVWAHNSHLGDARATEMGRQGEHNVGQLVRERYGSQAYLVGFSTYDGTVTAARDWDHPAERRRVRPALAESYEALFHSVSSGDPRDFWLDLRNGRVAQALRQPRLERAIGVVYRPETERWSHYFEANLPRQFDAVIHFDRTEAVHPLERGSGWDRGETPETFPVGV